MRMVVSAATAHPGIRQGLRGLGQALDAQPQFRRPRRGVATSGSGECAQVGPVNGPARVSVPSSPSSLPLTPQDPFLDCGHPMASSANTGSGGSTGAALGQQRRPARSGTSSSARGTRLWLRHEMLVALDRVWTSVMGRGAQPQPLPSRVTCTVLPPQGDTEPTPAEPVKTCVDDGGDGAYMEHAYLMLLDREDEEWAAMMTRQGLAACLPAPLLSCSLCSCASSSSMDNWPCCSGCW